MMPGNNVVDVVVTKKISEQYSPTKLLLIGNHVLHYYNAIK